jgi:hypothetical protein
VAVHHSPSLHARVPEQSTRQVTPNPPQLIKLLHDRVPEHTTRESLALKLGESLHALSPLQVTKHRSPEHAELPAQLLAPSHVTCVSAAVLSTPRRQESLP